MLMNDSTTTLGSSLSHKQISKLLNRVSFVENGLRNLHHVLTEYAWKHASVKNKYVEVARSLSRYAQDEEFPTTTKHVFSATSDIMKVVGNHRQHHVKKLEETVLQSLASYDFICKRVKAKLRLTGQAIQKKELKKKYLHKLQEKSSASTETLLQAELELQRAAKDASLTSLESNQEMLQFESTRVEDLKYILEAFFNNEMALHAKALELYTDAYHQVRHLNAEADIQVLRGGMALDGIHPIFDCSPRTSGRRVNNNKNKKRSWTGLNYPRIHSRTSALPQDNPNKYGEDNEEDEIDKAGDLKKSRSCKQPQSASSRTSPREIYSARTASSHALLPLYPFQGKLEPAKTQRSKSCCSIHHLEHGGEEQCEKERRGRKKKDKERFHEPPTNVNLVCSKNNKSDVIATGGTNSNGGATSLRNKKCGRARTICTCPSCQQQQSEKGDGGGGVGRGTYWDSAITNSQNTNVAIAKYRYPTK